MMISVETMRDKRSVDELSVEELERILAVRKREERQKRLERLKRTGRIIQPDETFISSAPPPNPMKAPPPPIDRDSTLSAKTVNVPQSAVQVKQVSPRFEDEEHIPSTSYQPDNKRRNKIWKLFVNRTLLLTEIVAVFGLIILGWNMVQAIGKLEDETAEAQLLAEEQRRAVLPTIAPTPQLAIDNFVLPSGHTPPTSPDGGQFNFEEVPVAYRALAQDQILNPVISRPPPTNETALRLIIPKLDVDQTIVQGVDWDALKLGIGQLQNGVNPLDETGNVVLAGHNDIYGEVFRHLDELEIGDIFQVQTQGTDCHIYHHQ